MDILRAISELVAAPGVTGAEQAIGEVVKQYFPHIHRMSGRINTGMYMGVSGRKIDPKS